MISNSTLGLSVTLHLCLPLHSVIIEGSDKFGVINDQ